MKKSEKFSVVWPLPESNFLRAEAVATGLSKSAVAVRCVALEIERRLNRAEKDSEAIQVAAATVADALFNLSKAKGVERIARKRLDMVLRGSNSKTFETTISNPSFSRMGLNSEEMTAIDEMRSAIADVDVAQRNADLSERALSSIIHSKGINNAG